MAYKIVWTNTFKNDLQQVISYLDQHWPESVTNDLLTDIDKHLDLIKSGNFSGQPVLKFANVKSLLVGKFHRMYFQFFEDSIELLAFFDVRQNPAKNPYE